MHTFLTKQTAEFPVAFYGSRKAPFIPPPSPSHKLTYNSHLSFILIFVCLPRAAMTPILHNAKRKSEYSFSPLCVFFVPLLQQGRTLLQLSRQVQPVRIDGARYSLAPAGVKQSGKYLNRYGLLRASPSQRRLLCI